MSAAAYREVTNQSWFGRIGNAFKGIVFGLILFVVAFPLLFWNEGRAVERHKTLEEGAKSVVSVSSDTVDPVNDGALVHLTGMAETDEVLSDVAFGVSANAIKLRRLVEMYQWEESKSSRTRKKVGGGTETVTEYSYRETWSDRLISSSEFKEAAEHTNPGSMPYESKTQVAESVGLGAFRMTASLVGKIGNYTPLTLPEELPVPEDLEGKAQKTGSGFYIGVDPSAPVIGDVRVAFQVALPAEVSVISKQVRETFEPYQTKVGGTIELLQAGVHSAEIR